jgi:hypothetical protein
MSRQKKQTQCQSHTCENTIDTTKGEYSTCALCRLPVYCSDECHQIDRALHACNNEIDVAAPLTERGFAVPYYYEDFLSQEEINTLDVRDPVFNAYSVRNAAPNRIVTQTIVVPLVGQNFTAESRDGVLPTTRGAEPTDDLRVGGKYVIRVVGGEDRTRFTDWTGDIPKDMIFTKNNENKKARDLAGKTFFRQKPASYFIFWPHTSSMKNPVSCSTSQDLNIQLFIAKQDGSYPDIPDADLHCGFNAYDLNRDRLGVSVTKAMNARLRKKFANEQQSVENLHVRRYGIDGEKGVLITFEKLGKNSSVRIIDIEFIIAKRSLQQQKQNSQEPQEEPQEEPEEAIPVIGAPMVVSMQYKCDPRNFQDVSALVMSIGHTLSTSVTLDQQKESALRQCEAVLTKYAHEMEENNGESPHKFVPTHVQSAIGSALDLTYEQIGFDIKWADGWWRKKATKPLLFQKEVERVISTLQKARTSKWGKPKKIIALRALRNATTAALEVKDNSTQKDLFEKLIQKIELARKGEDESSAPADTGDFQTSTNDEQTNVDDY